MPNIKNFNEAELKIILADAGFQKYRAGQIYHEIFSRRKERFEDMTTLPKKLRTELVGRFSINSLELAQRRISTDKSEKFLFRAADGVEFESVFMPAQNDDGEPLRNALCVSSQAGCPLDCAFCATAKLGFKRNLDAAEIIDQALLSEKLTGERINNVVFMGMGEPLLNYANILKSIEILTNPDYKLLSARKITVSTSGFPKQIKKLADSDLKIKLAISLHAPSDETRRKIMPKAAKTNLAELLESIEYYYKKTKTPISYEYILFDAINDSLDDAKRLVKIARRVSSKVNIIPFNDISFAASGCDAPLKPSSKKNSEKFADSLRASHVAVTVRKSFGSDIEAACGQLAAQYRNKNTLEVLS